MKQQLLSAMLILLILALFQEGCGKASSQTSTDTAASKEAAAADSRTSPRKSSPKTRPVALKASGKTEDGKPVSLDATLSDNDVAGTLTVGSRSLEVRGVLDGKTLRCWLRGIGKDKFRGNLIGTKKNNSVAGQFIISSNAGEHVIKGTVNP